MFVYAVNQLVVSIAVHLQLLCMLMLLLLRGHYSELSVITHTARACEVCVLGIWARQNLSPRHRCGGPRFGRFVPNLDPVECGPMSPGHRVRGPRRRATLGRSCVRDHLGPPPVACQPRGLHHVSLARRHPSQPKPGGEVLTGRNRQRLLHGRVKPIADIADNPAFVAIGRRGPSLTPPGIGVGARVPWGFAAVTRP